MIKFSRHSAVYSCLLVLGCLLACAAILWTPCGALAQQQANNQAWISDPPDNAVRPMAPLPVAIHNTWGVAAWADVYVNGSNTTTVPLSVPWGSDMPDLTTTVATNWLHLGTNELQIRSYYTIPGDPTHFEPYSSPITHVIILKVDIVDPEWTPDFPGDYSDVSYTFNSASPGVCTIPVEGTCGVPALNPNLEWELESMSGSTLGSTPDPAKGANVTYTYTTLPSANSEFGQKILSLDYPDSGCFAAVGIRIFFGKNASNNPGGSEPNWYYYWSQTSANYGTHTYNAHNDDYGHVDWGGSAWDAYICNLTGNTSIDWFGHVCRHEAQHVTDLTAWWPSGPPIDADGDGVTDNDADGDLVPDTLEPSLGYDPNLLDTDGDGYRDVEDHAYDNQPSWTYGSADTEDWANPGAQLTSP